MVTYQDLLQNQSIKKIEKVEKEQYVFFHYENYKIDINSAKQFLEQKNSKYAVIASYYAVLNITLWNLAKHFNLKISQKDTGVHTNCLIVLDELVKDKKVKNKILKLLKEAKEEFKSFTILKKQTEKTLPVMLKHSSNKRKKYTYYSEENTKEKLNNINEAENFLENTVMPYISIMEKLK